MKKAGLKRGEKVLFGVAISFVLFAFVAFVGMENYRIHSGKKMYAATSHYDFSPEGLSGSSRFRDLGCSNCHRAVRNGTNNGVSLDGVGSRRSFGYLEAFLRDPEATYRTHTMEHGIAKGADYVARLPERDLHSLAVFLSELKAVQGSPDARLPMEGHSGFIDKMTEAWAPPAWKSQYHDIRQERTPQPTPQLTPVP